MTDRQNARLAIVFVLSLLTLAFVVVLYAMAIFTTFPIDVETLNAVETVRAILEQTPTPERSPR